MDQYYNPFQAQDIFVPSHLHEEVGRYCQKQGNASIDYSPFPRMVDLWFLGVCIAAREGLAPHAGKEPTTKIIDGSIFTSDPSRVHILMLVAIAITGDPKIVAEPRKIMTLANGLAAVGVPRVIDMIKEGGAEPIWNLSDQLQAMLSA